MELGHLSDQTYETAEVFISAGAGGRASLEEASVYCACLERMSQAALGPGVRKDD